MADQQVELVEVRSFEPEDGAEQNDSDDDEFFDADYETSGVAAGQN